MDWDVKIEWTDTTWDPLAGCTRKSAACRHCYAEALTAQFSQSGQWGHGFAEMGPGGPAWTGKIELLEDRLRLPFDLAKPSRIFVNSLSDLFHESLPNEAIDRVFAVMALEQRHVFQVLTKRPKTMLPYLIDPATPHRIEARMAEITGPEAKTIPSWPLPNVWLGVTAENQKEADRRIPILLETPAAVRWIAAEPLLEPVDLEAGSWLGARADLEGNKSPGPKLDWIVAGGETGADAKACQPVWARSLRDQCARSGTPFFWTRWGEHLPAPLSGKGDLEENLGVEAQSRLLDGNLHEEFPPA